MTITEHLILPVVLAIAVCGAAVAQEPQAVLEARAEAALQSGDRRTAIQALERLRFQQQLSDRFRLELARGYMAQGRLDQARIEAAKLEQTTSSSDLLQLQAELAALDGHWAEARDRYAELLRMAPRNAEAYLGLGQALQELGEMEGADAAFAGYIKYSD